MFMTYLVMNKPFIIMQKFCLILVLTSVIFMVPLIIWRGLRGNWSFPGAPMHLCRVMLKWPLVILASLSFTLPTSATWQAQWVRGASMSTVMCTLPMVTPMVIGSSLITIAGLMRTLMPVLCPKGWIWVGCFISTRMWLLISAIWGWRIIQVIRVITLLSHIMCSHICTIIITIIIMIMVIITMPSIIWSARSWGGIPVMIFWITRLRGTCHKWLTYHGEGY